MTEAVYEEHVQCLDYYNDNPAIYAIDKILNQTLDPDISALIDMAAFSGGAYVKKFVADLVAQVDVPKLVGLCDVTLNDASLVAPDNTLPTSVSTLRKRKASDDDNDNDVSLLPVAKRSKPSTVTIHKTKPHKNGRRWRRVNGRRKLRQHLINVTYKRLQDERMSKVHQCCEHDCWMNWPSLTYRNINWHFGHNVQIDQ